MPVKKADKRSILKESLNVFRHKGYHNASMSDIAAACGLLKGSIYHYFEGKEDLMREVIAYLHDWYSRKIFSIAYDPSLSGKEKLETLIQKSEEVFFNEPGGCLMANIGLEVAGVHEGFSKQIRDYFEDWVNCLAEIFKERHTEELSRDLAEISVAELEGGVMLMQIYQDKKHLIRIHNLILKRFENTGTMIEITI